MKKDDQLDNLDEIDAELIITQWELENELEEHLDKHRSRTDGDLPCDVRADGARLVAGLHNGDALRKRVL